MFLGPDGGACFSPSAWSVRSSSCGIRNGMIDVMDKHFQDELGLTKAQSAWVQFAHYLGYFLMSMPAGWLGRFLMEGRHHRRPFVVAWEVSGSCRRLPSRPRRMRGLYPQPQRLSLT
jgi:hypothetical protein